jgi:ribose 5-phosphate isomerase B
MRVPAVYNRRPVYTQPMRVAIGADHAGLALKEAVKQLLDRRGIPYDDHGTRSADSVDYPDFAALVARQVSAGEADRGILVCGSGIGMAIAANKVPGVRAAAVTEEHAARLMREHNDANILALGERLTPEATALKLVEVFLDTPFSGGRHQQRVDKIRHLEGA